MTDYFLNSEDYRRIEKAINFIDANFKSKPSLDQIAESVHLSKFHFDRLFKRWAGISPMQFQQYLTLEYTKKKLTESNSILDTSYDAGLSGPGRLHDLFVNFEAMTPGEFKKQAAGLKIKYGFERTPFGECLLAATERGICHLGFVEDSKEDSLKHLFRILPGAEFSEDKKQISLITKSIFAPTKKENDRPFNLHLKGTNFQTKVWQALLKLPCGSIATYSDMADYLGNPKAVRAVASAIASNPIAYLIPCHRVISKTGRTHHYLWGSNRKKAILSWEAAKSA